MTSESDVAELVVAIEGAIEQILEETWASLKVKPECGPHALTMRVASRIARKALELAHKTIEEGEE